MTEDDFVARADRGEVERRMSTQADAAGAPFAARLVTVLCETRPGEWAIWIAVSARLPASVPLSVLCGLTGAAIRTTHVALNRVDLEVMLAPGLAALGLTADLVPLPDDDTALRRLLRTTTRKGGVPLFAFPSEESAPISVQALATEVASDARDSITIVDSESKAEVVTAEALRERYTHVFMLRRSGAKGLRRANRHGALARWAVFEAAFPERVVGAGDADAPMRALAAQFLRLSTGGRRDRASNLLRRAAILVEAPYGQQDITEAFELLREHLCLILHLPHAPASAILALPERPLTNPERSELIYLARAGTRDLKALAARRLAYERSHSDAERTLEQLLNDPDPLVRGAARHDPEKGISGVVPGRSE